ncbi:hypothetical protein EX30DRAFT_230820 [Ascodesmis nigricans]|uniref:Life-span regulatory factor-domain-containing protein n=1 Tax=Ascodesmis nigricans TaxID=341454 RepID=A0A4S2MID4_9PEZI|nr:hypothetical protein EX30DRAFT_230820 [Ascodesmis nigricans]
MAGYKRRALKPALAPRTTSKEYNGTRPAHGRSRGSAAAAKSSTSSSSSATQRPSGNQHRQLNSTPEPEESIDTDPSMAQSFLPYCAHCEKQIVIPNNSILYCSERCRRKDNTKPVTIPSGTPGSFSNGYTSFSLYSITPPLSPFARDFPEPTRNIVEPLSPTPPYCDDHLHDYGACRHLGSMENNGPMETEIFSSSPPTSANSSNIYAPPRRPHHIRRGTSGSSTVSSTMGIPMPTQQYQFNNHHHHHHQHHRPLPPLRKPSQSSSSPRSIELVTPYLPITAPATIQAAGEIVYEKKPAQKAPHVTGNINMMFNFDAIRSHPPSSTSQTGPTSSQSQGSNDPYHRFAQRPITFK